MICYINPELEFIYVNKHFAHEFGFPKEFFLKKKIHTIIPSEYLGELNTELSKAFNGQFASFEANGKDTIGEQRFFSITIIPQKDEDEKVSNLITLIYEITLIKQTQEEILQTKEVIYNQEKKFFNKKI